MLTVERILVSAGDICLLTVTVEVATAGAVVRAQGELDAYSAPAFGRALVAAEALRLDRLVVDLTGVTYASAASVAILHRAAERARDAGVPLVVETGADGRLERVLSHLAFPVAVGA